MARTVRLPNGRVIRNVPESATKEEIRQKAIQGGLARPEDFARTAPQRQERQAAPTPPSEMMARERAARQQSVSQPSQMSERVSPSGRLSRQIEQEQGVFERARQAAEAAGVDPANSAPTEARLALALSAPSATEPPQQADVVRNALGEGYDVRVGPETGEVEWREKGSDQYSLVNPPGLDIRDLAQATPETLTLASGAGFGAAGLAAGGITGRPIVAGASTTLGVGFGEGLATKTRLELARQQGYLPELSDEDITEASIDRAIEAAAWTAGGGAVARGARQLLARQLGASPEVIEALSGTANVDEAFEQSRKLQSQVQEITGERPPLTAGQAAQSPEMRLAEEKASGQGRSTLGETFERQQRIQEKLESNVLGAPVTSDEAARVSSAFERKAQQDVSLLEERVETATSPLTERAGVSPERAASIARGEIVVGRKRLFEENFAPRYQAIFENARVTPADLTPLRAAGANVRNEKGQQILPSVSLTEQKILKEAENAGLRVDKELTLNSENLLEWRDKLISEDTSLTEVQNALVDVRRELRRPGITDDPQKAAVLREIETSLEQVRSNALGPQKAAQLEQLDAEYARAASDYNESFIDEFTTLRADGTPIVNSDQAFERIIRSPEEAATFVDALGRIPTGSEAISQFRRGIVSRILDRSTKDGEVSDTALRNYLTPQRRRALKEIFGDEDIASKFDNVKSAAEALRTRRNEYVAGTQVRDRVLGESFTSPTKTANEVYAKVDQLTPERINTVRTSLPKSERGIFDRALATEFRDELVDSNNKLSPEKIDKFLQSQGSRAARAVFGEAYLSNLRTLRDFARLRQPVTRESVGRPIDETLGDNFQKGIGGAEGMQKFLRVPFPPLSVRGRALTATLGQLQERGQAQLAEILADPQRFNDLRRLLSTDFYSRNFDKIAARLGIGSVIQFKNIIQGNEAVAETANQENVGGQR